MIEIFGLQFGMKERESRIPMRVNVKKRGGSGYENIYDQVGCN